LVGTSKESFAAATKVAIEEAAKTVHHLDWFEVAEMRGAIKNGKVSSSNHRPDRLQDRALNPEAAHGIPRW